MFQAVSDGTSPTSSELRVKYVSGRGLSSYAINLSVVTLFKADSHGCELLDSGRLCLPLL